MEKTTIEVDIRTVKTVDSNEPGIIRDRLVEVGWQQKRLYSADFSFWSINYKKIGVERKDTVDLFNSLGERLSQQLYKMLEHYDFNILLIEGSWKNVYNSVFSVKGIQFYQWSVVWNFLRTWQDKGLTIELTTNPEHTVKRLGELYTYYQKEVHTGGIKRQVVGDPRLLAFCTGIGPVIGKELLEKFGSLRAIANATVEDFLQVDKIGQRKAQALYDHFNSGAQNPDQLKLGDVSNE